MKMAELAELDDKALVDAYNAASEEAMHYPERTSPRKTLKRAGSLIVARYAAHDRTVECESDPLESGCPLCESVESRWELRKAARPRQPKRTKVSHRSPAQVSATGPKPQEARAEPVEANNKLGFPYIAVPMWAVNDKTVPAAFTAVHLRVYIVLLYHFNGRERIFGIPHVKLAREARQSRTTLWRVLKDFMAWGLVEELRPGGFYREGRRMTAEYRIETDVTKVRWPDEGAKETGAV
jgi:hypothetical protein